MRGLFFPGNNMTFLLSLSRLIDRITTWVGKLTMWLILAATLISAGNAIVRKAFNMSSNGLLEIQWYLFAAVFMLGAGYGFLKNTHVRIDFISSRLSHRARNWIDVFGIVAVLMPFCVLMISLSWGPFVDAYASKEMSQNAGGLIRWPSYALVPLGFSLLGMQAVSELIKRVAFLMGRGHDALSGEDTKSIKLEAFQMGRGHDVLSGEEAKSDEQKHMEELEIMAARKLA